MIWTLISRCRSEESIQTHIVVVPDVDLRDLPIGQRKGLSVVPPDIILEIVFVAFRSEHFGERVVPPLRRIPDVRPLPQRAVNSDSVVIDLVTASDRDVPGPRFVLSHHIVPQRRAAPCRLVGSYTEAVARVEHDSHRFSCGRDEEVIDVWLVVGREAHVGDGMFVVGLCGFNGDVDVEGPEGVPRVRVEAMRLESGVLGRLIVDMVLGCGFRMLSLYNSSEGQERLVKKLPPAALDDNQHAPVPEPLVHATIIQQRPAHDLLTVRSLRPIPLSTSERVISSPFHGRVASAT